MSYPAAARRSQHYKALVEVITGTSAASCLLEDGQAAATRIIYITTYSNESGHQNIEHMLLS